MTACLTLGRVARKPAGEELPGTRRSRPSPRSSRLIFTVRKRMAIRFTTKLIRYVKPRIDIRTGNALISACGSDHRCASRSGAGILFVRAGAGGPALPEWFAGVYRAGIFAHCGSAAGCS